MEKNILNLLASGSKHTKHQNDAEFGRKSYPLNSKKSGGKLSKKVERPSIEDQAKIIQNAFLLENQACFGTFQDKLANGGKPFQIFEEKQIAEIILKIQELIQGEKAVNKEFIKNLDCEQLQQMNFSAKNIIIHVTLSGLFKHCITKDILLQQLFSQKL